MSRAFSYAGCPTTVMSLWRISDKTTPEILGEFYWQIKRGKDIDLALHDAKLKHLTESSGNLAHPTYWAAMVVHGSTNAINKHTPMYLIVLPIILVLALASIFYYRRWNNSR
jgi:CHAT domain-containing protein